MIIIENKKNCTGCYGCVNACPDKCITMKEDTEGFWYPEVDATHCMNCSLCTKVCPVLNKSEISNTPIFYACHNKNRDIRLESSSGGVFNLIAEQIIARNGIVFGARFDEKYQVIHDFTDKVEDLKCFRGSKYVQSRIGSIYRLVKQELNKGKHVLFSGTPCQVEGLMAYLGKEYENLLCVDFICHGVPSPKVWQKYIEYRRRNAENGIKSISFREKSKGWKHFCLEFVFESGEKYSRSHKYDLFMQAFLRNVSLRPSCYSCKFKSLHRISDITLADFWGIQHVYPDMDDDKGTSLVFANSAKGRAVFNEIKEYMTYKKVDIDKALPFNMYAVKSAVLNANRQHFFEKLDVMPFDKLVKKYCSDKFIVSIASHAKRLLKTILDKTGFLRLLKNK